MIDIPKTNVLIVDDDPVFRISLRAVLEQAPGTWLCQEASSVQEAVTAMSSQIIDLAIIDVHLPDGTAIDIVRRAGQTPCLLCTQDDNEPTFRKMFEDSSVSETIVGYLTKPLQPGIIFSIRAGLQIGHERQIRNRLVAEATAVLEEERRHIAQNLHDAMGASLTQLNWIFIGIERAFKSATVDSKLRDEIATFCSQGKDLVADAHKEVSEAVTQLRPEIVSVAGLKAGIEYMMDQWERTAPTVEFEHELDPGLAKVDLRKVGVLYRLVQEGITNAMRHADPSSIRVVMVCHSSSITLAVQSSGRIKEVKDNYALTILRERTSSLGGTLQFSCDNRSGETSLLVTIPN